MFTTRDELVAALRRLATDPQYRQRLGRNARRGFETYWTEAAVVPRYFEVLQRAAARKGLGNIIAALDPSS